MGWIVALSVIGVLIVLIIFSYSLLKWNKKRAEKLKEKGPKKIKLKKPKEKCHKPTFSSGQAKSSPPHFAAGGIYKLCKFTAEIALLAMSITSCYSL